jgi:hypothetical protein
MARCAGIKRDGGRCTVIVNGSQTYCYQHDPKRAEERRRNASRAARAKPSRELTGIKQRLSDLADDVLADKVHRGVAAVASQILNVYLRAVSVELKAREHLELTERLEALEEALKQNKENRWYGA